MKLRRIAAFFAAAALAISLCGCSTSGEYSSIKPHFEQSTDLTGTDIDETNLTASDYTSLRSLILRLVENSVENATITITDYTGDVQSDVLSACREVQTDTPLGVYAVEYMSYECVRILSHYEAMIDITYRRTPEEIAALTSVTSVAEFRAAFSHALATHTSSLSMLIRYYYSEQYTPADVLDSLLLQNPAQFVAYPAITVTHYPDDRSTGWSNILDISFDWGYDSDELARRTRALDSAINILTASLPQGETECAQAIAASVYSGTRHLPVSDYLGSSSDTAYGALVDGAASGRGTAAAVAAICDAADIENRIVEGRYNSHTHYWNIVRLGRFWYHLDASHTNLLLNDSELPSVYSWTITDYPVCRGESLNADLEPEN